MDLAPVPSRYSTVPLDALPPAIDPSPRERHAPAWPPEPGWSPALPGTTLQMRHDLLREQFQVLQVIKHRVQEQVLRTSTHDGGELLRTFRRTPPDAAL